MKYGLLVLLFITSSFGKTIARQYSNKFFTPLYTNPSKSSSSVTTIPCGFSVKILSSKSAILPDGWLKAEVGDDKGYVRKVNLSNNRPDCFQSKYSKFYLNLNLDLSDMYYFGRLEEQLLKVRSGAK